MLINRKFILLAGGAFILIAGVSLVACASDSVSTSAPPATSQPTTQTQFDDIWDGDRENSQKIEYELASTSYFEESQLTIKVFRRIPESIVLREGEMHPVAKVKVYFKENEIISLSSLSYAPAYNPPPLVLMGQSYLLTYEDVPDTDENVLDTAPNQQELSAVGKPVVYVISPNGHVVKTSVPPANLIVIGENKRIGRQFKLIQGLSSNDIYLLQMAYDHSLTPAHAPKITCEVTYQLKGEKWIEVKASDE